MHNTYNSDYSPYPSNKITSPPKIDWHLYTLGEGANKVSLRNTGLDHETTHASI